MSVAQTVQSFAGIANENEFYGHHYLAEVFKGDIRALIESWQAVEDAAAEALRSDRPPKMVRAAARPRPLQTPWWSRRQMVRRARPVTPLA